MHMKSNSSSKQICFIGPHKQFAKGICDVKCCRLWEIRPRFHMCTEDVRYVNTPL